MPEEPTTPAPKDPNQAERSAVDLDSNASAAPMKGAGGVDPKLLALLVCPLTKTLLRYDAERQELISRSAGLAFPIRNGVPLLIEDAARPLSDDELR